MSFGEVLAVVVGLGSGTMAFRLAAGELRRRTTLPKRLTGALDWVPVAVLAALVVPFFLKGEGAVPQIPVLGAGVVTAVVTYTTRNLFLGVGLGMGTFWLARVWF